MSLDIDKAIREREKELNELKRQKTEIASGKDDKYPSLIMKEIQELKKLVEKLDQSFTNAFKPRIIVSGPAHYDHQRGGYTPTPRPLDQPFAQGDQIIYIPPHAVNDWTHPDCERGFVTGVVYPGIGSPDIPHSLYCRFWKKDRIGEELATTANSQLVSASNVRLLRYMDQEVIDKWMNANYRGWVRPR